MSLRQFSRMFALFALALSIGVMAVSAQSDSPGDAPQDPDRVEGPVGQSQVEQAASIQVEVAEDGNRFIFDDLRLFDDGLPGYGSAFVMQGYFYPPGTLNGTNGVLPDGSPEFPDKVLGQWTCYVWMIGEGAHTTTGQWVISTQVYQFEDGSTLITDGFELVDVDMPVSRAITGGTGSYRGARGEMVQILRGFTEQMGVNLSVEFQFDAE